jgi:hypothetical protein
MISLIPVLIFSLPPSLNAWLALGHLIIIVKTLWLQGKAIMLYLARKEKK